MKTLITYITICLLVIIFAIPQVISQNNLETSGELEAKTCVLIVQNRTDGKQVVFAEGMKVRYWMKTRKSSKVGIIDKFEKNTIVLDGMNISLDQLAAIKIKDKNALNAFKITGSILGICGAVVGFGILSYFGNDPTVFVSFAIGGGGLITSYIALAKASMKYHVRKYHFQIIDVTPEQLQYDKRGKLEYIALVYP